MTQTSGAAPFSLNIVLPQAALLLLGYLSVVVLFTVFWTRYENAQSLGAMDARLRTAATSLPYLLAGDFHDRAVNATAIDMEEELANRERFNSFTQLNGLSHAYTLVESGGKLYFSSPTVSPAEARYQRSWYFYPYENAPGEFFKALTEGHGVRLTHTDDWGEFRTVCLFNVSPGGRRYLSCTDMELSRLETLRVNHMLLGLGGALVLLGFLAPSLFLIRRFYRMHIAELGAAYKKTQDHLELLRTLVHRLPVGLMLIQPNNRISLLNPAFTTLTGYSSADIATRNAWFRKILPDMRERCKYLKSWVRSLKAPQDATTQIRVVCKDGSSRILAQQLRLLEDGRILIILDDVSAEQENQARVRQDMERLRTILDVMQVGIAVVGVTDRKIHYVNPRLIEMTGLDRDQLCNAFCYRYLGRQCEAQCPVIDRNETVQNREMQLSSGASPWHVLKSVARAEIDGEAVVIESFADITGQKKLVTSLSAARDTAEKAVRDTADFLAEMGRRAYAALHEVMVPLQMLRDRIPDEGRSFVSAAQESTQELRNILQQTLALSALDARGIADALFSVRDLIASLENLHEKAGTRGLRFVCAVDSRLPDMLCGDVERIGQVLRHLVESSVASTEQECILLEISPLPFCHASGRGFVHFGLYETRLEASGEPVRHLFDEAGIPLVQTETGTDMILARRLLRIMGAGLCVMAEARGCTEAHFSLPLMIPEER